MKFKPKINLKLRDGQFRSLNAQLMSTRGNLPGIAWDSAFLSMQTFCQMVLTLKKSTYILQTTQVGRRTQNGITFEWPGVTATSDSYDLYDGVSYKS